MIRSLRPRTSNPPATSDDLALLQESLGGPIPAELRSLLTEANGAWIPDVGIPSESCPEVPGGGIGGEKIYSVREIIEARNDYHVSAELLVFGHDDFGNALCIGLSGPRRDKIYFWDHEDDVAGGLSIGLNVDSNRIHQNEYFVASSLREFISLYRDAD